VPAIKSSLRMAGAAMHPALKDVLLHHRYSGGPRLTCNAATY
jgi:hypothetical protein